MISFENSGPIIACSTGTQENTAIAIIRISSTNSLNNYNDTFSCDLSKIGEKSAVFCRLINKLNNEVLDEVVVIKFNSPRSYTGENLLEIHVHGNQLNIKRILTYFTENYDLSLAKPGEFSYRAYQNGKLNLMQLESLETFLNATNSFALSEGMSGLNGKLFKEYTNLKEAYIDLRSVIEMGIDFLDDIGEAKFDSLFKERADRFNNLLSNLHHRCSKTKSDLMNPSIVLMGEPNSGKSTLFNNFLRFDRSIVSDIQGTTRDIVSEYISINGNTFKLVDTAGIRDTKDIIEKEGVKRTFDYLDESFFVIQVLNLLNSENGLDVHKSVDLLILTNVDKPNFSSYFQKFLHKSNNLPNFLFSSLSGPIGPVWKKNSGSIEPVNFLENIGPIEPGVSFVSGPIGPKTKDGPIELSSFANKFKDIEGLVESKYIQLTKNSPINSDRQVELLTKSYKKWLEINKQEILEDITLLSHEFNSLSVFLDQLLGITTPDNVLNHVFSNFCIGK